MLNAHINDFFNKSAGKLPIYFFIIYKWGVQIFTSCTKDTRQLGPKKKKIQIMLDSLSTGLGDFPYSAWLWCTPIQAPHWREVSKLWGCRLGAIVKDDAVPHFPDNPVGCYHDFPEDDTAKVCSCFYDHVQRLKISIPMYVDRVPTALTEGAFKEEVKSTLFHSIVAKDTAVVIYGSVFSS